MLRWIESLFRQPVRLRDRRSRLGLDAFEARDVPSAGVHLGPTSHTLNIAGGRGADQVAVSSGDDGVRVTVNGRSYSFTGGDVSRIVFAGGRGGDAFTNDTDLPCTAAGGAGSDTLTGGTGDDTLTGGTGDDTLVDTGGSNRLRGGAGRDQVAGNDADDPRGCEHNLLTASLSGTDDARGRAAVLPADTDGVVNLRVGVDGLAADTTYSVQIAGTEVGEITTDVDGRAHTELAGVTSAIADGTEISLADGDGTVVLTGTFAADSTPPPGGGHGGHDHRGLGAPLAGDTDARGLAVVVPSRTSADQFDLHVDAGKLTAGATYTVVLAGATLGTFAADDHGHSHFDSLALAQTVAVGDALSVLDDTGATVLEGAFVDGPLPGGPGGQPGGGPHGPHH